MLLLALGENEAATVLKHLDAKVVQRLGSAMAQLKSASREEVTEVVGGFVATMDGQADIKVGSEDYIRNVLTSALGNDKASGIIDRILVGRKSKGLDVLKWMEPRAIAELVKMEHPQVLAIVISYLDADLAARVLTELPQAVQSEVLLRVAQLDGVQPAALGKLDEMIEKQIAGKGGSVSANLGGAKSAASILNFMPGAVMEDLRKVDEVTATKLQDLMFIFGDMISIDDKGIQSVLREVDSARLVVALKGADQALVAHFLKNMSSRAAEMLKDDMESRGPVKLSEVEAAQKEILLVARRLADAGTIVLGGAGGEQYV
jgi:flagellar motor switch protein FliG